LQNLLPPWRRDRLHRDLQRTCLLWQLVSKNKTRIYRYIWRRWRFFVLGLSLLPRVIKRVNRARFNVVEQNSPVGYAIAVLLA
jgi:hypothetical protein